MSGYLDFNCQIHRQQLAKLSSPEPQFQLSPISSALAPKSEHKAFTFIYSKKNQTYLWTSPLSYSYTQAAIPYRCLTSCPVLKDPLLTRPGLSSLLVSYPLILVAYCCTADTRKALFCSLNQELLSQRC